MTIDRDHILRLYAYHHWAADRLLGALAPVTAARLDEPWGGSFATGRGLLRHAIGAERVWVTRWNGTSPERIPEFPATHAGSDFRREWERVKSDQLAYLSPHRPERLGEPFAYVKLGGERRAHPLADVLLHVVNHGTYHRGQLAHLLRDLGLAPPGTDYLDFLADRRLAELDAPVGPGA
jgi:uncharacterized damage-inducible protein DinB